MHHTMHKPNNMYKGSDLRVRIWLLTSEDGI